MRVRESNESIPAVEVEQVARHSFERCRLRTAVYILLCMYSVCTYISVFIMLVFLHTKTAVIPKSGTYVEVDGSGNL